MKLQNESIIFMLSCKVPCLMCMKSLSHRPAPCESLVSHFNLFPLPRFRFCNFLMLIGLNSCRVSRPLLTCIYKYFKTFSLKMEENKVTWSRISYFLNGYDQGKTNETAIQAQTLVLKLQTQIEKVLARVRFTFEANKFF